MKHTTDENTLMIRYLLGDVSEDEQVRLEEQFLADNEKYEQLVALEDELRYDYAQGNLNSRQRGLFEKRFLTTPDEKQKVALAKAVLGKASEEAARLHVDMGEKRRWWETFAPFISRPVWFASAAAATAALCAIAFFSETLNLRRELKDLQIQGSSQQIAMNRELQQERSKREQLEKAAGQPKPTSAPFILAFALSPGLQRDTAGPKRLRITPGTDSVRLRLDLKAADRSSGLRASLQNLDGQELWSQDVNATAPAVVLTLPGRLLAPGDYLIELKPRTAAESAPADEFYFTIVR